MGWELLLGSNWELICGMSAGLGREGGVGGLGRRRSRRLGGRG